MESSLPGDSRFLHISRELTRSTNPSLTPSADQRASAPGSRIAAPLPLVDVHPSSEQKPKPASHQRTPQCLPSDESEPLPPEFDFLRSCTSNPQSRAPFNLPPTASIPHSPFPTQHHFRPRLRIQRNSIPLAAGRGPAGPRAGAPSQEAASLSGGCLAMFPFAGGI